eukprot:scaffold45067_cov33-Attheya_sp.AAC.1
MSPGVVASSVTLSTRFGIRRVSDAAVGSDGVTIGSPEAVLAGAGVEGGLVSASVMLASLTSIWGRLAVGMGSPGSDFAKGDFFGMLPSLSLRHSKSCNRPSSSSGSTSSSSSSSTSLSSRAKKLFWILDFREAVELSRDLLR